MVPAPGIADVSVLAAEILAAEIRPWAFVPHPEVWALIGGLAGLYAYAIFRIGPTATRPGEQVVTRGQIAWFVTGLLLLWGASDWPVHDVGEQYLYSVHMAQHLVLSLLVPPMLLLATPTWLARMVVGQGILYRVVRWATRLVPATIFFNAVVAGSHIPGVVNASSTNGLLHYGVHVLVVGSAVTMWMPIAGPLPELRFSLPVQMIYLFVQSLIPTVPAGWLTFADKAVYKAYDIPTRVWALPVTYDQQLAGLIMKTIGGLFLWGVIATLFIRFATKQQEEDDRSRGIALDRRAPVKLADGTLTWDQVERELQSAGPAPPDPADGPRP